MTLFVSHRCCSNSATSIGENRKLCISFAFAAAKEKLASLNVSMEEVNSWCERGEPAVKDVVLCNDSRLVRNQMKIQLRITRCKPDQYRCKATVCFAQCPEND